MPIAAILLLLGLSALLAGVMVFRPAITIHPAWQDSGVRRTVFLPVFCFAIGMKSEVERSKSTAFCLSCHIMEPYGKSLHVDDPSFLAA